MAQVRVIHIGSGHPARHIRIHQKECRSLAASGYEVGFIALHDKHEVIDGVKILPIRTPRNRLDRFFWWPLQVLALAIRENADIYHIHNPSLIPVGRLLAFRGRVVVYDMHENNPKMLLTVDWLPRRGRALASHVYAGFERLVLGEMPVIFAESSYSAHYPWVQKHETVLNMPDVDQLLNVRAEKHETPTLVYFGVVLQDRGALVTIEALRILRERGKKVNWICIGTISDRHRREVLELAEEYRLIDQIELRGWVAPGEGWLEVAKCHVGLALLEPSPNYVESYPTKIFEYMAMGLPVITSNFPLYKSVVEGCGSGICVAPKDADEVVWAVEHLLDDAQTMREMGNRGRQAVIERYGWRAESNKLLSFYESLLSERLSR